MKTSVSMWSVQEKFFEGKIDTPGFIELASSWQVDGVELLDTFFKNSNEVEKVIKLLKQKSLPVSSYSISNDFVVEDDNELKEQIAYVKDGIDMAVRLNAPIVRVFSGNSKPDISFERGMERILDGFRGCIGYAEERGITLSLENHGLFAGTSSKVRDIIETIGSPNLRATADTGNFLLVLENPVDAVKDLKELVGFVHFKDFKGLDAPNGQQAYSAIDHTLYQGTPIGKGDVDLVSIVNVLQANGYDGYLSIEYEGVGDPIKETEESIAYLKSIIL